MNGDEANREQGYFADLRKPKHHYDVVICITGFYYFMPFVDSLVETVKYLTQNGISVHVVSDGGPDIHNLRGLILNGGHHGNGGYRTFATSNYTKEWRAFNNEFTYDQIVWIDNDIYWLIPDFMRLIEHKEDVVAGLYLGTDTEHLTVRLGPVAQTSRRQLHILRKKSNNGLLEAFSVGMGFMKVRYGVVEDMTWPIFFCHEYSWTNPDGSTTQGRIDSEDASFCERVRQTGRKVYVDTEIVVGHYKRIGLDYYGGTPFIKDQ